MTNPYFVNPWNEDDRHLKISKMEYLSNRLLDHSQILNLHDQTIFGKSFKWRPPHMEDNFKILKVEYLSNHPTHILNLPLDYQTILYTSFKWRGPPIKVDLKILKLEYRSHQCIDCGVWVFRGKQAGADKISGWWRWGSWSI